MAAASYEFDAETVPADDVTPILTPKPTTPLDSSPQLQTLSDGNRHADSVDLPVVPAGSKTPGEKLSQIRFFRPALMALFARVTTYPPLGQVTVIPPNRKQFNFTVIVESTRSLPERPWEVSIWYDHGTYSYTQEPWKALDLQPVAVAPSVLVGKPTTNTYKHVFEGYLPNPFPDNGKTYKGRKVPFTVRYRIDSNAPWQWVGDNYGTPDGEVILQPPIDPNFLGASPVELRDGWSARKLASEAPGARLYMVESSHSISGSPNADASEQCFSLGYVMSSCKWFALVRIWEPWLAPRHGNKDLRLTEPAILLAFLRADGQHVVLLAPNGIDDCLTTFTSDGEGNIVVCARNDTGQDRKFKVIAATAWSFEVANAAVMYEMRKRVRGSDAYLESSQFLLENVKTESVDSDTVLVSTDDNRDPRHDDSPTPQWLASWYDSLAYCTWNSLGQDLTAEKIMNGLQSLADNKIYIANLIIDDNWQSLEGVQGRDSQFQRGWTAFEANPIGFPDGLKVAVDRIRTAHPRIRDIAVWHALTGYWGCVSSTKGHLKDDYQLRQVRLRSGTPAAGQKYMVDPVDIHRMYNDFYQFLSSCGVTAVKTDVQFYLDLLASSADRRDMTIAYQSAWTQAHLRHLSGRAISCMSCVPQIIYHSFLPTNTPRVMLRNSDDFFPDVPTSHPWHVFSNAHTALFVQHLNVLPDWDMFQTSHPYSAFHAAARCVSGGPIYITDTPGEHDVDLIHQMTALNPRGETIVLRPSTVGKTLGVYDKYDEGNVLKVGCYDGKAETGIGFMGLFNIAERITSFVLPADKIPGVEAVEEANVGTETPTQVNGRQKWVIRSHVSRRITAALTPTIPPNGASLLEGTLEVRGYDIWSAIPVRGPFHLAETSDLELAVLGLLGKMTGACAVVESTFDLADNHRRLRVHVQLKALGVLGVWVSDGASRRVEDLLVMVNGQVVPPRTVRIVTEGVGSVEKQDRIYAPSQTDVSHSRKQQPGVVEIDVLAAWEALKVEPGWNNEVGVELLVS